MKTTALTQLGQSVGIPASPHEAELEDVNNPHTDVDYVIRFTCPEFTSLCPITNQPDFAHFVIDYSPSATIIESKSLKLFLASFRNFATFHEDCTVGIAKKLISKIEPKWLRISGYWYPRGGIPIDIYFQHGVSPSNLWVPDIGVPPYRGRG